MRFGGAWVAVLFAACGGEDDGDAGCEELLVEVSVTDADGAAVPGLEVSLDDTPCTDSGDGVLFECVAPDTGEHNAYALATGYESKGQLVTIETPEDCAAAAATVDLVLLKESGV